MNWRNRAVSPLLYLSLTNVLLAHAANPPSIRLEENVCETVQQDQSKGWPTLTVYKLYYNEDAWSSLEKVAGNKFYRGMRVTAGILHNTSWDVSAPNLMPILKDRKYQSLLCEYGAILAVANDAEKWASPKKQSNPSLIPSKWVGFESWRAERKKKNLMPAGMSHLEKLIKNREIPEDAILYWGKFYHQDSLLTACKGPHGKNCLAVYSQAFKALFDSNGTMDARQSLLSNKTTLEVFQHFLPDVPSVYPGLCYFSYFAMTWKNLVEYARFARAFFVVLESLFNVHEDVERCPIDTIAYPKKLCWCFIMERLVNIWMYHSGKPIFVVNRIYGAVVVPQVSSAERNSSRFFEKENMERIIQGFRHRLSGKNLALYENLF